MLQSVSSCYLYLASTLKLIDINECLADPSPCDTNATCTDTLGSYECTCMLGWSGDALASPIGQGCHGKFSHS